MGKDSYSAVEVAASSTRRIRFTAAEKMLSAEDQYNLAFCFRCSYCLLVDLLPVGDPGLHTYACFLTGTQCVDVLKVAKSLKGFSDLLVEKVTAFTGEGPVLTMLDFKRLARSADLYMGLVTPVRTIVEMCYGGNCIPAIRTLYQWFEFLRHVNVKSLDLERENVKTYLEFEGQISTWTYDAVLCDDLALILTGWTENFSCDALRPQHGPGSIAGYTGKLGILVKDCLLCTDARLDYFLRRCPALYPFFPSVPAATLSRQNEIVFVPKKMDTNRVISKEPCTLAYFQQGVQTAMVETIFDHPLLKGHVNLSDQARSRDFAWEGSVTGEYATLDLSSASDSVTLSLIKLCIRNPVLRRALVCTRSDSALLPSGEAVTLGKFAPMGSAVCFPVETMLFAGICEMAVRRVSGHTSESDDYVVYGDDIVIRRPYVEECLRLLAGFHFSVNERKSFTQRAYYVFREACGGYYLNGEDITPLRLSRRLALMRPAMRESQIGPRVSLIALCNGCLQRGLIQVRLCGLAQLKEYFPQLRGIPFTRLEDEEVPFALQTYADSCTNVNLRKWQFIPSTREWWGESYVEVFDVATRADAKKIRAVVDTTTSIEWMRWYEYWRARAYANYACACGADDEYAPKSGVTFAPEPMDLRPQRTSDVRRWRMLP